MVMMMIVQRLLLAGRQRGLRAECNRITVRHDRSSVRSAAAAQLSCGPPGCLLRRWRRFGWPLCHRLARRRFRSNL